MKPGTADLYAVLDRVLTQKQVAAVASMTFRGRSRVQAVRYFLNLGIETEKRAKLAREEKGLSP
jgi:hypothetical protein